MSKGIVDVPKFVVRHDLDLLAVPERIQYLRDVSEYIGLDPDLNGLDLVKMKNETQPGYSLVVYARRGTAEILRNIYEVEVETLTYAMVNGSIVYTATGRSKKRGNRQEIAIGSKYIEGLEGKELDNAIMTGSTRSLQRLTMQFTTLGILGESEVVALVGQEPNPAGSVQLALNSIPQMLLPSVPANNAPGKMVVETKIDHVEGTIETTTVAPLNQFLGQNEKIAEAWAQLEGKNASQIQDETGAVPKIPKVKKPRKQVSLDVEPETVNKKVETKTETKTETIVETILATPVTVPAPPPPAPAPQVSPVESPVGLPTSEQMATYRAKIGAFTKELTPRQDETLGSVQKMRAFITYLSNNAPQDMTVTQWEHVIQWFDNFVAKNSVKALVDYINVSLTK